MCMQTFIKIYQKVQEIGSGSLFFFFFFFSESEPRQNLERSQMTFVNLLGFILSISVCMKTFITIFYSVQAGAYNFSHINYRPLVQEIGPFSLVQNLASTDDKCRFAICLSKYELSTFFAFCPGKNLHKQSGDKIFTNSPVIKSSQTVRGRNFHKQSGDKIFTNSPVTKSSQTVW